MDSLPVEVRIYGALFSYPMLARNSGFGIRPLFVHVSQMGVSAPVLSPVVGTLT